MTGMEAGAGEAARWIIEQEDELVCQWLYGVLADCGSEAREILDALGPLRENGTDFLGQPRPEALNALRHVCRWALDSRFLPYIASVPYTCTFRGSPPGQAFFVMSSLDQQRLQQVLEPTVSRRDFEIALTTARFRAVWLAQAYSELRIVRPVLDAPVERDPPRHGRLRDGIVGRAFCEEIAERLMAGQALRRAAGEQTVPAIRAWVTATAAVLDRGLTNDDIGDGLRLVTQGLRFCDWTVPHPVALAGAYLTLGLDYLEKVEKQMPDHIEASGQGSQRAPVIINGNVGAFNSKVTNSSFAVAETIRGIEITVGALDRDGQSDTATALRDLIHAIQQDPALADHRAQLLDHVADVAEAAAEPDRPRALSRARLAMAAITGAAGASAQLAQALTTWHDTLGRLF
ncbi:hypothetical protein ACFV0O_04015 [Kitasatospora sp. NPDC059577]|uniref:hypothetical protein n=1 Tax=Kitasatospora sp. NPDC059577 TaxID=3346873 RepID=UPI0036A5CD3E